jgi:hypothetical protein
LIARLGEGSAISRLFLTNIHPIITNNDRLRRHRYHMRKPGRLQLFLLVNNGFDADNPHAAIARQSSKTLVNPTDAPTYPFEERYEARERCRRLKMDAFRAAQEAKTCKLLAWTSASAVSDSPSLLPCCLSYRPANMEYLLPLPYSCRKPSMMLPNKKLLACRSRRLRPRLECAGYTSG